MTRKEFNLYKQQFEREGYIHESVVKELFETIEQQFTAQKEENHVERESRC